MHFYAASSSLSTHLIPFTFWHGKSRVSVTEDPNPQIFTEKKKLKKWHSLFFFLVHKYDSLETQKQFHLYKKSIIFHERFITTCCCLFLLLGVSHIHVVI